MLQTFLVFPPPCLCLQIVAFLLQSKASVQLIDHYGCTALHKAATAGHLPAIHLLVEKGAAGVNTRDGLNLTPLHRAASCGHVDVASYLLDHGADPSAACWLNKTPLHLAADQRHFPVMELLLAKGANLTQRTQGNELAWERSNPAPPSSHIFPGTPL